MAKNKVFLGVYEEMVFPEYEFQEYPKYVQKKDGTSVVVNNHAEELRMVDDIVPATSMEKVEAEKENLEKLLAEAKAALKEKEAELAKLATVKAEKPSAHTSAGK